MKSLLFACDHAGYQLSQFLIEKLKPSYSIQIVGAKNSNESIDYPEVIKEAASIIKNNASLIGIFICGSGMGVCIMANRYSFVRAVTCTDKNQAALARQHNNANVLCLGARIISKEEAIGIAETFLTTTFEGGRHEKRVKQLENP